MYYVQSLAFLVCFLTSASCTSPRLVPKTGDSGPAMANAQQVAASDFKPLIASPAFEKGAGPLIFVDEAHNNFHTLSQTIMPDAAHEGVVTVPGRLGAFRELLLADGYRLEPLQQSFSAKSLEPASILVISNALADENVEDWGLPNPSAFDTEEIEALLIWIRDGGALLLVADHQPWPAAAENLASELGFIFNNGSAGVGGLPQGPDHFSLGNGTLIDHPIVRGRNASEAVASVMTFGGQAFRSLSSSEAVALMIFPANSRMVLLEDPNDPEPSPEQTITIRVDGMMQGAVRTLGLGKVAVFGEAAMFTAQVFGPNREPMGLNHPEASENAQFVLNLFHWLSGLIPGHVN